MNTMRFICCYDNNRIQIISLKNEHVEYGNAFYLYCTIKMIQNGIIIYLQENMITLKNID